MAITAEQQQAINKYTVGLFNAPSGGFNAELAAYVEAGNTPQEMALVLAGSPAFKNLDPAYGDDATNEEFATAFLNNLLGDTVTATTMEGAIAFVVDMLDTYSRAEVAVAAIDFIATAPVTSPTFGDAAQQLANRIEVATYYNEDLAGDSTDLTVLQGTIDGVTEDPATVEAALAELGAPDFTLTSGLEAIDAANDDLSDFFAGLDLDLDDVTDLPAEETDGEPDYVDADGNVDAATARTDIGLYHTAAEGVYEAETGINLENDSAVLQAAKLQDAQDADAALLAEEQEDLAEAQAAVDAIDGLQAKIDNVDTLDAAATAASEAATDAAEAQDAAHADFLAEEVRYEANTNDSLTITYDVGGAGVDAITTVNDGTADLIVTNADGELELGTDITETTNPGVTAVLNEAIAYNAAVVASDEADTAATEAATEAAEAALDAVLAAAQDDVDAIVGEVLGLDLSATDATLVQEVSAVADVDTAIAAAETAAGTTYTEILTGIETDIADTVLTDDGSGGDTTVASFTAAMEAYDVTNGNDYLSDQDVTDIVTAFTTAYAATPANLATAVAAAQSALEENNWSYTQTALDEAIETRDVAETEYEAAAALATAEADVTAAEDAIQALDDAIADLEAAQALVDEMGALDDAIVAAQEAVTDEGYVLPDELANADALTATADGDIYMISDLVAGDAASIASFGAEGADVLYIGADYTLNAGDIAEDGDNAVLEVFFVESGADTVVTLETEAWGSNSTDAEIEITLTGVTPEELAFADGMVTLA